MCIKKDTDVSIKRLWIVFLLPCYNIIEWVFCGEGFVNISIEPISISSLILAAFIEEYIFRKWLFGVILCIAIHSIAFFENQTVLAYAAEQTGGGEEFLFFFPGINLDHASTIMSEINIAVSKSVITYKDLTLHVTMTFGVEENDFHSNISEMVKRADDKLYYGKTHGRDTVIS